MSKLNLVTPVGIGRFVHLNEPDGKFDPDNPKYKTDLIVTEPQAQDMLSQIRTEFGSTIDSVDHLPIRQDEDKEGNSVWVVRAKRAAKLGPPRIVDAAKNLTTARVGAGSKMRLAISVASGMTKANKPYVTAYLNAVQVVELSEGASAFDEIEGGFVDSGAGADYNGDF